MNIIEKHLKNIRKGYVVYTNMKKVAIIGLSGDSLFYELDHLPKEGETVHAISLHKEIGGKGFNQAVACKRDGLDVYYLSALGCDSVKKDCEEILKNEGINFLLKEKNMPSASASIINAKNGENEVVVYGGANSHLDLNDLEDFISYIEKCDAILLTYEIPYDVLKKAIEIAKKNNKMIIINPAPYIYDDIDILKDADIISPNETEMMEIAKIKKIDDKKILKFKNENNIKCIVLTLGSKGVKIFKESVAKIKAHKADAVDTTGAGDVFNGCMVSKILEGKNIYEACEYAALQASKSVCKKYVLDAIPRRSE